MTAGAKVCIAGKNAIAVECTEYLLSSELVARERILVCFNATDQGRDSFQPSFRRHCERNGLRETTLDQIKGIVDLVFISLEFDRIVPVGRFATSRLFNIHYSLLPRYKGMYTSAWPILNGEEYTGVTLHCIDAGIDTGDIIDQVRFEIGQNDTSRDLYFKYTSHGIDLFRRNAPGLLSGTYSATPQPPFGSSYYAKTSINYRECKVDLNKTAFEIRNQIRAFAFREYQLPHVHGATIVSATILSSRSREKSGTILREDEASMDLATIDYDLRLIKDFSGGGDAVDAAERGTGG
jgi:methionyl-tRNA formyltransferase